MRTTHHVPADLLLAKRTKMAIVVIMRIHLKAKE
jgi:hypothetical protein